jgi:hypothetical protein
MNRLARISCLRASSQVGNRHDAAMGTRSRGPAERLPTMKDAAILTARLSRNGQCSPQHETIDREYCDDSEHILTSIHHLIAERQDSFFSWVSP